MMMRSRTVLTFALCVAAALVGFHSLASDGSFEQPPSAFDIEADGFFTTPAEWSDVRPAVRLNGRSLVYRATDPDRGALYVMYDAVESLVPFEKGELGGPVHFRSGGSTFEVFFSTSGLTVLKDGVPFDVSDPHDRRAPDWISGAVGFGPSPNSDVPHNTFELKVRLGRDSGTPNRRSRATHPVPRTDLHELKPSHWGAELPAIPSIDPDRATIRPEPTLCDPIRIPEETGRAVDLTFSGDLAQIAPDVRVSFGEAVSSACVGVTQDGTVEITPIALPGEFVRPFDHHEDDVATTQGVGVTQDLAGTGDEGTGGGDDDENGDDLFVAGDLIVEGNGKIGGIMQVGQPLEFSECFPTPFEGSLSEGYYATTQPDLILGRVTGDLNDYCDWPAFHNIKVGIGTGDPFPIPNPPLPGTGLHVEGEVLVTHDVYPIFSIQSPVDLSTLQLAVATGNGLFSSVATDDDVVIRTPGAESEDLILSSRGVGGIRFTTGAANNNCNVGDERQQMVLTSAGNLGIGPDFATGGAPCDGGQPVTHTLHVGGNALVEVLPNGQPPDRVVVADTAGELRRSSVPLSVLGDEDDDWYEVGTSTPPDDINAAVYTLGQVGVGTTDPVVGLDVFADALFESNDGGEALRIRKNPDYFGSFIEALIIEKTDDDPTAEGGIVLGFATSNANDTAKNEPGWAVNHSATMVIRGDGNVGIGVNSPSERLDVNGQARVRILDEDASLDDVVVADTNGVLHRRPASGLGGADDDWTGAGSGGMHATHTGDNVAIGKNTAAVGKLDVQLSGTTTLASGGETTRVVIRGQPGNPRGLVLGNDTNGGVIQGVDGGFGPRHLRLQPFGGGVGIGTPTVPQSALQVEGYIQMDVTNGPPPAGDCVNSNHEGRMIFDPTTDLLYICSGASGWVSK